ncbi:MAG: bifunctional diaminohydroxyphosphoribosylaminopyrimidine deaminase/5-amino-6-(5-phosphoribosylamino)uracil reductase RibD [Candidatus Eremiobacter antarcticus]|nr:bifunctional diaminohydroxyphosphoribosylaminopyrimidine deaminase/5-amino-6-(5-phosphoribosylamino)uracil reductase RibD [Candidatus Eremiobacteraeota bacterium]PZR64305.1 MAG: bifunctional diaminohydroxyphosphoribosylaminopyrimidine deaminase/5-amino-6-(5-phosphoribosylamino)uracil reductase RibD [Candidatus Eremiobacter sp. RRmetagenome_bin22]
MDDERYMRAALRLAARGQGNTSPNPMVGALVVSSDGLIVGSGYHARAGSDHAETIALNEAGARARDATLYVTLEPCAQQGRTPPCVDAIAARGIKRVVFAVQDPDQQVRGRGAARLRELNIDVDSGVAADEAEHSNRMYLQQRRSGRPYMTLKMAQSLDGKISPAPGSRVQLTGKQAGRLVRMMRYSHDAVMVGVGTIAVDDPQLTVRPHRSRAVPYTRIIVDSSGSIPLGAKVLSEQSRAKTIVATTDRMPPDVRAQLQRKHIQVIECAAAPDRRVQLADLLTKLGSSDVISVLCEGGPTLAAALLREHLVDELQWFIAPLVIATSEAVPAIAASSFETPLTWAAARRVGEDVLLSGRPQAAPSGV